MLDQENEFAAKISQIVKYILGIERRLNDLSERFERRPELQQLDVLQNTLAQIEARLNEHSRIAETPIETINPPSQVINEEQPALGQLFENQLVFDRAGSRATLLEALSIAIERLIIVCPWLSCNSIDADLIQRFRDCLERDCCIEIGWGHLSDRERLGKGWRYNALEDLRQLERDYPEKFKLKLIGTHEKFLVCDRSFAFLGSHNLLTSGAQSAEREVGIRTTDINIIQGLIDRFDCLLVQNTQTLDEGIKIRSISLDNPEVLETLEIDDEFDVIPENFDIELDTDTDDFTEESQEPIVSTEEFLQRCNQNEKNFTGINLTGANLVVSDGRNYSNLNLSKANLTRAKLNKVTLYLINLNGANLRRAELVEVQFHSTNLTEADLDSANLTGAKFYRTSLDNVNLRKANLSGTNLFQLNLSRANLIGANLERANLRKANLVGSDLRNSNLSQANLLEANLEGTNLQGVKLRQALCNIATIFPAGFDPVKLGAYLIIPNTSLPNIDLVGADLNGVNLTGADLHEAKLNSVNLCNADLSEANLSRASLVKANLSGAKLLQVDLSVANLSNVDLSGANLTVANLSEANLIQANLNYTNLTAANLSKANLKNANLGGAIFCGAILTEVNFIGITFQGNLSGADLTRANLCGANLSCADLSGANLTSADLRGANLSQANLEKANLKDAKLGGANLNKAKLSGAIMPDGTTHE